MVGESCNAVVPRNICKFCNKDTPSKFLNCVKCNLYAHKRCCDKNNVKIAECGTKINCCASKTDEEVFTDCYTNNVDSYECLAIRVQYLNMLIIVKDKIICDKMQIIRGKEHIINLLTSNGGHHSTPPFKKLFDNTETIESTFTNKTTIRSTYQRNAKHSRTISTPVSTLDGTSVQASSTTKITSMSPSISAGTVRGSIVEPTTVIAASRIVDSSAISKNPQPVNRNDEGTLKSISKAKNKWTVTGSATGMTVKASQKKISLFVSRIHPQTSLKDCTEMVHMNHKAQCKCLKSKHPENYLSFKVIINECDLDKAKVVMNWSEGTLVMNFFQRSAKRTEPS